MMPVQGKALIIAAISLAVLVPTGVFAHGGGPLDASGCHYDRRVHDYHCHSGKLRGKHFKSRADMLRMLKTGDDTAIAAKHPGRFQDLASTLKNRKAGDDDSRAQGSGQSASAAARNDQPASATTAVGPMGGAATAAPSSLEERLSVLKRLYEKDLITKREYDEKRQQILDSL